MSHRYPTRFQATFRAKQLQAAPAHRYQTRFQTKKIEAEQRRAAEEAALTSTVEYSRELLVQINKAPAFIEKLELLILLYQHLYDTPILLTSYERFRTITWEKMNEQEAILLTKLQTLPARLAENNAYDMRIRSVISELLDQMEWVRMKYW